MIAVLCLRNSSFLCKSRVSFSASFHPFYSKSSKFTGKEPIIDPTVYDFFSLKHNFSPEAATELSSVIPNLKNPEISDSLLSFLKENEFSNSHLVKILKYKPSFISADLEKSVKPKIKVFQELGISNTGIADLCASNVTLLHRSARNTVIPALSVLRDLLGSDANVVKLVTKHGLFLVKNLNKVMVPNIEFLKSRSVPVEQIIAIMHSHPRFLMMDSENMRRYADKAEELGADRSSGTYIQSVRVISAMGEEAWERKLEALRSLRFSESDIWNTFRKYPIVFSLSVKNMREVYDVLLSSGKYDVASIVSYPMCFSKSIENKYKPRLKVLAVLERMKLIENWPTLAVLGCMTDMSFVSRYVAPHIDKVGHLFDVKDATNGESKPVSLNRFSSSSPEKKPIIDPAVSLHRFSSSSPEKKPIPNSNVYDFFLHKLNFSPKAAAELCSVIPHLENPEISDSLLSFLKEHEFSNTHLEKILKHKPSFISTNLEKFVKPKIKIFQEFGFSNKDIADLCANASVLHRSANDTLIPALSMLRGLLGSDANVVKLVMKYGGILCNDLDKSVVPNIEFLKGRSVPMEQIITTMHSYQRFLLQKPDNMRRCAEKAEELGVSPGSRMYIHAVRVIASMSDEAFELKLKAFQSLGFSKRNILKAFRKSPAVFAVSVTKMMEVRDVLVSTGKYDAASIVHSPLCLLRSVEKRYKPRLQVLTAMEHKNLIKKWPALATLYKTTDMRFFKLYVARHVDEVGHLFDVKGSTSVESMPVS